MLNVGDTLILELKHSEERDKFKCRVVDIRGSQIAIDYPVNEKTSRTGFFLEGTQFKASFIAKDSAVYMFDTEVQARKKLNIPVLILDYPDKDEFVKIQRREFVRVDTAIDVAIHPPNNEFQPFTTITADISAGGVAIYLPERHRIRQGMKLKAWFVLPLQNGEYHYLKVDCSVIRVIPGEKERDKAPLKFEDIKEAERQLFLRLCFDRQLSMRKANRR